LKRQWSDMKYNRELDSWFVFLHDCKFLMHCGYWFELSFGESSIPCRLEMDREWYVIMRGVRFYLHPKETYKVEI
jgi:hypothetical protein